MRSKQKAKLLEHLKEKFLPEALVGMDAVQAEAHLDGVAEVMLNQVMKAMTSTWSGVTSMVKQAPVRQQPIRPGETVTQFIAKDRDFLVTQLEGYWAKLQVQMSGINDEPAEGDDDGLGKG